MPETKQDAAPAESFGGPEILSRKQLQARYGIPAQTWYKWDREGIGVPSIKIGRMVRYRAADVEAWLESRRRGGNPQ